MTWVVLACQAIALLSTVFIAALRVVLDLPVALVRCAAAAVHSGTADSSGKCAFYEGTVEHVRKVPVRHAFEYRVRMALLDLDDPPQWFQAQASDHMTAGAARQLVGSAGPVKLLTQPRSAGYTQNPISVYYCCDIAGSLTRCIAEVTNTPWGERVTFAFDPKGDTVAKALHVSPLMDMEGQWLSPCHAGGQTFQVLMLQLDAEDAHPCEMTLKTRMPGKRLALSVAVRHPEMGPFFCATLSAVRSSSAQERNEYAGFSTLWRYGYQPQRVALWIYLQALLLLRKGVQFHGPPTARQHACIQARAIEADSRGTRAFVWRPAAAFPWRT